MHPSQLISMIGSHGGKPPTLLCIGKIKGYLSISAHGLPCSWFDSNYCHLQEDFLGNTDLLYVICLLDSVLPLFDLFINNICCIFLRDYALACSDKCCPENKEKRIRQPKELNNTTVFHRGRHKTLEVHSSIIKF